jgi:tetratricopeptide (TPR) repeat protein
MIRQLLVAVFFCFAAISISLAAEMTLPKRCVIALEKNDFNEAVAAAKTALSQKEPASVLEDLAIILIDKGGFSQALDAMQAYLEAVQNPGAEAWLYAGIAAKECRNYSKAKLYFQKGLSRYPEDPFIRYNAGYLYFVEKEYQKAEQIWSSLADADRDASLLYHRALALRYCGDLTKSQLLASRAIAIDPKADYYNLVGTLFHQLGKEGEALENFKKALAIDPGLESAQLNIALYDQSSSNIPAMIASLKARADTCTSECEEAVLKLSLLYYKSKKTGQALSVLEKVPLKNRTEKIYRATGFYLSELGRFEEAIAVLEKAKKDLVIEQRTEMLLIDYYIKAGHASMAIEALKTLVPFWDGNPWRLYYQLGYLSFEQNKLEAAQRYFEKSMSCTYNNPAARGMLAFIFNKIGKTEKARALWEQTITQDPNNPTLWINLGLLHDEKGEYNEAVLSYEKAYALDTTNKALCLNIGNVYAALNRHLEARYAYGKALNSPMRELAAYNMFISGQKEGPFAKVEETLKILESEFPKSPYTLRALSEKCIAEKDTVKAIGMLESISDKNEEDRAILAFLYLGKNKVDSAQKYIERLPKTSDWRVTHLQLRASLAFAQGDYNGSYSLFEALHDSSFATAYNMALSAYNAKRYDETIRIANAFLAAAKGENRISLSYLAGNAYFAQKKWEQALQLLVPLSTGSFKNAPLKYNVAVAYCNVDNVEQSWRYYKAAQELDSNLKNPEIEAKYAAFANKRADSSHGRDESRE